MQHACGDTAMTLAFAISPPFQLSSTLAVMCDRDDFRTRMRQGYCWYLSVSLLVVAFNVSAVAMIVCEKPDAKGANTERCHLYSD